MIICIHTHTLHAAHNSQADLAGVSVSSSTNLLLGQTNVFLCIAEFRNVDTHLHGAFCEWSIGDVSSNRIQSISLYGCDPLKDTRVSSCSNSQ